MEPTFVIGPDKMSVMQDGRELAATELDPSMSEDVKTAKLKWGMGVFGPFQGALTGTSVE